MNIQTRREIRFGLIALVLSGLLYTLGVALRGPIDPDPASLMRAALSPHFAPGLTISLVGGVLQVYGLFGLYRYLTYQRESLIAFLAVVLSIASLVLILPLGAFLAVNVPVIAELYQQGNQEVIAVVESNFSGLGLALLGISSVVGLIDPILFAIAIWQHKTLPKWISVVWGLKGIMLALSGPGFFTTELLGAALLLLTAGAIAWKGWQESTVRAGQWSPAQV